MAHVHLPRSLVALLPGIPRRSDVPGDTVADVLLALDAGWPGTWDRVCTAGPRIREHMNVYVDGVRAELDTRVGATSMVHVIPAVSGGTRHGWRAAQPVAAPDAIRSGPSDPSGGVRGG